MLSIPFSYLHTYTQITHSLYLKILLLNFLSILLPKYILNLHSKIPRNPKRQFQARLPLAQLDHPIITSRNTHGLCNFPLFQVLFSSKFFQIIHLFLSLNQQSVVNYNYSSTLSCYQYFFILIYNYML